jgi:hypothetical protein
MNIQDSIFGQPVVLPIRPMIQKKVQPIPMAEKKVEISPVDVSEIPYSKEALQLLKCTTNRMYMPRSIHWEVAEISDRIIRVSKTFRKEIPEIVEKSVALLKSMPNLYVIQAISMAMGGEDCYGVSLKKI